jgi:hypothetical protein
MSPAIMAPSLSFQSCIAESMDSLLSLESVNKLARLSNDIHDAAVPSLLYLFVVY